MNPNQALWELGDFTKIADCIRDTGEAIVANLGITAGQQVLDLGCGDGTTALPAAKRGAQVLGIDIARNLVEAGTRRAASQGLAGSCRFQHGDASELTGIADASFDLVLSIFGAMFAPKPFAVAKEMVRVTRRGGRIVMGNWIPGDPTLVAQLLKTCAGYLPPPPAGSISPMTWGIEDQVVDRFHQAGIAKDSVTFARDTCTFILAGPPSELVALFRDFYGPLINAFATAAQDGRATALQQALDELFQQQNRSGRADETVIPATFLRVTVLV